MHKIYIDSGPFNLNYQIPYIFYSSLITVVINILIKFLALSEKPIILIKRIKSIENIDEKAKELISELKIKFIMFFIVTFIFLSSFCFYIACFCGIYINTQIHLIKDSLVGFGLSLVYPFFVCLIPGIFRIPSLKGKEGNKECLYKLSKIIQIL